MNPQICLLSIVATATLASDAPAPISVGIEGQWKLSLTAPDLRAIPLQREAPLALRIASAQTENGSTMYDLRYIGLVPGRYDLRSYLTKADGSPAGDLSPMEVEIRGVLPPGPGGTLVPIPKQALSLFGGYQWLMIGLVALWAGAAVPLFLRRRSPCANVPAPVVVPPTLNERLRPLVEGAAAGKLSVAEKAHLERMILAHWCERRGFQDLAPAEAIARLRSDPEAGALLRALEDWLHRPPGSAVVDLEPLLSAYTEPRPATNEVNAV